MNNDFNKVLFLVGEVVEDYEGMVSLQGFQSLGFEVHAANPGLKSGEAVSTIIQPVDHSQQKFVESNPGYKFFLNYNFDEINENDYIALIISGVSVESLKSSKRVIEIARHFLEKGKLVATLRNGALIFQDTELLKGRILTGSEECATELKKIAEFKQVKITECVRDGNLVSAAAWTANTDFYRECLKVLNRPITDSKAKRVLMILRDQVESYEFIVPFQVLSIFGHKMDVVSPNKKKGEFATSDTFNLDLVTNEFTVLHSHDVYLNYSFADVKAEEYDALLIPGNAESENLKYYDEVSVITKHFLETGKLIGTICNGGVSLTNSNLIDLVKGREVTTWRDFSNYLIEGGVKYIETDSEICVDKNIVSANAWPVQHLFVSKILEFLSK